MRSPEGKHTGAGVVKSNSDRLRIPESRAAQARLLLVERHVVTRCRKLEKTRIPATQGLEGRSHEGGITRSNGRRDLKTRPISHVGPGEVRKARVREAEKSSPSTPVESGKLARRST